MTTHATHGLHYPKPLPRNAASSVQQSVTLLQETGSVKLLLLDNIAAFYWIDRATTELPGYAVQSGRDAQIGLQQAHACVAAELSHLLRKHRLALIATRHSALSAGGFDRSAAPAHSLSRGACLPVHA